MENVQSGRPTMSQHEDFLRLHTSCVTLVCVLCSSSSIIKNILTYKKRLKEGLFSDLRGFWLE